MPTQLKAPSTLRDLESTSDGTIETVARPFLIDARRDDRRPIHQSWLSLSQDVKVTAIIGDGR